MLEREVPTTVSIVPSARRLIESLRNVGYDFNHAVADLVDNSISAGATCVDITLRFEGNDSWVRIADNGTGMAPETLTEALRLGAERDYTEQDLGKFGLGLKTASTSQCSRITVASRIASSSATPVEARCLDLEHLKRTDTWEAIHLGSPNDSRLTDPLRDHPGTVVVWESLDRVLVYKNPWGSPARKHLEKLAEGLDEHLGMVFHRFIAGEARSRPRLRITINGTCVDPWDPFCREEEATRVLPEESFEVQTSDTLGIVRFTPFILPRQDAFSSRAAWDRAGRRNWNHRQGFYIYRSDRLIQDGGWNRMRTADEHNKLARAGLDFYPDLDGAFDINIAKMRVNLPANLRDQLRQPLERWIGAVQAVYRPSGSRGRSNRGAGGTSGSRNGRTYTNPGGSSTRGGFNRSAESGGPVANSETSAAATPKPSGEQPSGRQLGHDAGPPLNASSPGPRATTGMELDHGIRVTPVARLLRAPSDKTRRALESAADTVQERPALERIVEALKVQSPEVARDLGW